MEKGNLRVDTFGNLKNHNFVVPVIDTDSLTVCKQDGSEFSQKEIDLLTEEINELTDELINWEFEFYIPKIIVVKSKNYVLDYGNGKVKTKGSSIRDQKKEPAMREMMDKLIQGMLDDKSSQDLIEIYHSYIKEALNMQDISRWSSKKTITEAVLDCAKGQGRKNEMDVFDAIKNETVQGGDKIYVYPVILGISTTPGGTSNKTGKPLKDKVVEITGLKLSKNWTNDHNVEKLLERCFATVKIFSSVLDMNKFLDYSKAKNRKLLPLLDLGT